MPYYSAGDYYQGGDNYGAGDFLGIGKFAKRLAGNLIGNIPIVGGIAKTLLPGISGPTVARPMILGPVREPGVAGVIHRTVPGGKTGVGRYTKKGEYTERAIPRMQVTNTRALKRAGRRVRGFLKIASRLGALPISRSGKGKLFKKKRR